MPRWSLLPLLALATLAAAGDEPQGLELPPTSIRARHLREEASAAWQKAMPMWDKARAGQEVTPQEAAAALPEIEEAVKTWEKSLHIEWNSEANRTLAQAVRAWHKLHPLLHAPDAGDAEAQAKAAQEEVKQRRARKQEARSFVMAWGAERRASRQLRRCPQCEGRKDLRSPFGEVRPCPGCGRTGVLLDREAVIEAHWLRMSPLFRDVARNVRDIDRMLTSAGRKPDLLAPFLRSVAIKDVEDNDVWIRITTKEKIHFDPDTQKTETRDETYTLFRVGDVWYLYDESTDKDLLEIPPVPKGE